MIIFKVLIQGRKVEGPQLSGKEAFWKWHRSLFMLNGVLLW